MARVNVSIPDDVIARARAVGLNVSAVATSALEEALERRLKIAMVDQYLAGIAAEAGSMTEAERRDADAWLDSAS
ncbi:MAG TPA: type II toxin-antitoxin system CcdA family antitoxin [Phycicoccus sp.]|nr:type II toxin-antitoxin system CcdA family antitoxin [Phycicoccus sp.]